MGVSVMNISYLLFFFCIRRALWIAIWLFFYYFLLLIQVHLIFLQMVKAFRTPYVQRGTWFNISGLKWYSHFLAGWLHWPLHLAAQVNELFEHLIYLEVGDLHLHQWLNSRFLHHIGPFRMNLKSEVENPNFVPL